MLSCLEEASLQMPRPPDGGDQEQKNALPSTCLFGPSNRSGCLFRLGGPRARAAGLLRSSDGHCGGARRDCRREAMQWAVGLPVCPLVLSAMLDIADAPAVVFAGPAGVYDGPAVV